MKESALLSDRKTLKNVLRYCGRNGKWYALLSHRSSGCKHPGESLSVWKSYFISVLCKAMFTYTLKISKTCSQ